MRPRAWAMAQRRHVARLWHREKGLTAEQKTVLDALHHLPDQQRKVLLLTHLAGLTIADIGRELGETPAQVEHLLTAATRSFCRETGCSAGRGPRRDRVPGPDRRGGRTPPARPDPPRGGRRRRRLHAVGGVAVLLALTLVGGLFVVRGGVEQAGVRDASSRDAETGDRGDAAEPGAGAAARSPREPWQLLETSDNTSGTGINTVCQATRFADPRGRGTFVRRFFAPGATDAQRFCETVEISRDAAGCRDGVPDHAGLVRRLQPGAAPAAQRLPGARPRRGGADAEAPHPQRGTPHLRRRRRPDRLA